MGTTLTGTTPQDTYDSLIKVTDNGPLSGSLKTLTDGLGNDSALALSTGAARVTGLLGIGTTPEAGFNLDILTALGPYPRISGSDQANVRLRFSNGGAGGRNYELMGGLAGANNSNFSIFDATASATRLTIDSTGNVGIGTTSPDGKLDVASAGNLVSTGVFTNPHLALTLSASPVDNDTFAGITFPTSDSANYGWSFGAERTAVGQGNLGIRFHNNSATGTQIARFTTNGLCFGSDTAAANALDDYEEGTWTATLTDGTVTKTATCNYTKIGRIVYLSGGVSNVEDPSSFTGNVYITGVPFVPAFSVSLYGINNYLDTASVFVPYLESNQQIRFYKVGAATADYVQMQGSDLNFYSDIIFAGQFTV